MPVIVTDADSLPGRLIVTRLLREGGEVRAYCTGSGAGALRAAGAVVASGDLDDEGHLESAMEQVHTVVHPGAGLLAPSADHIVTSARTVATAAAKAGVRRVVALSVTGARLDAPDALRRAQADAEEALAAAGVPTVVIRTSLVDAADVRDTLALAALDAPHLDTEVAPVRLADVVELVTAFDALRSNAAEGHVVFRAHGADRMPVGRYLERVGIVVRRVPDDPSATAAQAAPPTAGDGDGATRGLTGRVYRPLEGAPLLLDALTEPWIETDPRVFDAWEFTGLHPSRL